MKYRIWSIEHNAWWKPLENGYTRSKKDAGIYSKQRAEEIVFSANRYRGSEQPNEALVPVQE